MLANIGLGDLCKQFTTLVSEGQQHLRFAGSSIELDRRLFEIRPGQFRRDEIRIFLQERFTQNDLLLLFFGQTFCLECGLRLNFGKLSDEFPAGSILHRLAQVERHGMFLSFKPGTDYTPLLALAPGCLMAYTLTDSNPEMDSLLESGLAWLNSAQNKTPAKHVALSVGAWVPSTGEHQSPVDTVLAVRALQAIAATCLVNDMPLPARLEAGTHDIAPAGFLVSGKITVIQDQLKDKE